jgi:hypothetical protein
MAHERGAFKVNRDISASDGNSIVHRPGRGVPGSGIEIDMP